MNNPRKCTSAEYAEVRLRGKELPITFLLDLLEFFLENNIFYLGVQQTVTQVVYCWPFCHAGLRGMSLTPVQKACGKQPVGYFSTASCVFLKLARSSGHVSDIFSFSLPGGFAGFLPSLLTPYSSQSLLENYFKSEKEK